MIKAALDFLIAILLQTSYIQDIDALADLYTDGKGLSSPKVYNSKGELKEVTIFDKKNGYGYIRTNGSVSYALDTDASNVPGSRTQVITFPLRLVMAVPKNIVTDNSYTNDDLALSIISLISSNNAEISTLIGAQKVVIQAARHTTEQTTILGNEYSGLDLSGIRYKFAYVAIDFNIAVTIDKDCIAQLCQTDIDILGAFNFCDNGVFARLSPAQITCLRDQLDCEQQNERNILAFLAEDSLDTQTITIPASLAGTYTAQGSLVNIDSITYTINAVAAVLPFTVVATDSLEFTIVRTIAGDSSFELTGSGQ